jgi:hypothetical protein
MVIEDAEKYIEHIANTHKPIPEYYPNVVTSGDGGDDADY